MADEFFDVLVIGAGIHGLASAYHLGRLGVGRVGLIERFSIGHTRGSSHGAGRITRSAYSHADYVRLMTHSHAEEWPRLQRDLGEKLIFPCDGVFFGPGQLFAQYAEAVAAGAANVEQISPADARRRFAQFRFDEAAGVLVDHTAGIIAAATTIASLADHLRRTGVAIRENVIVVRLDRSGDPIRVITNQGELLAARVIVTAGAWVRELLPELALPLSIARQSVCYFEMEGPVEHYRHGAMPVWVYLGDEPNDFFYGLPEFGGPGIKAARHVTRRSLLKNEVAASDTTSCFVSRVHSTPTPCGRSGTPRLLQQAGNRDDDPNIAPSAIDADAVEDVSQFVHRQFAHPVRRLVSAEHCLYTMTSDEEFFVDLHPDDPRVAIGSACSGHGFKFGPLVGRVLAELVTRGTTSVDAFEALRQRFEIRSSRI